MKLPNSLIGQGRSCARAAAVKMCFWVLEVEPGLCCSLDDSGCCSVIGSCLSLIVGAAAGRLIQAAGGVPRYSWCCVCASESQRTSLIRRPSSFTVGTFSFLSSVYVVTPMTPLFTFIYLQLPQSQVFPSALLLLLSRLPRPPFQPPSYLLPPLWAAASALPLLCSQGGR